MKSLKEQFIMEVVKEAVDSAPEGRTVRVLDLGCGTAGYVPGLLAQFPTVEYVGVEPIDASYKMALKNLEGIARAKVHFQLGYDSIDGEQEGSFDVVFSLSVLEHIKQLGRFLCLGTLYVKSGGLVVHRYDLGHALYPHSLKERLHVWLGNNFPHILPERQFVRYVPEAEVRRLYKEQGVTPYKTTYHQMQNHKALEKYCAKSNSAIIDDLFVWEMKYQKEISALPTEVKERLFPAVTVWGKKE